ncbi:MAG: DUF3124 domain-containing protein [Myxococcota bacterium]|jgi:hypothetical protein|nr:DUF3124 domain-containing protein [Myxococcota bacterium]
MGIIALRRVMILAWGTSVFLCAQPGLAAAESHIGKSRGQILYAAAFSYVELNERGRRFPLTPVLIVRNTDLTRTITVTSVEFRRSSGELDHRLVKAPTVIKPLASREFRVQDPNERSGQSPSFIVRWEAGEIVNAPMVEVLMFGAAGLQGTSIQEHAWVLEEANEPRGGSPEASGDGWDGDAAR